jgi:hypothetical protein
MSTPTLIYTVMEQKGEILIYRSKQGNTKIDVRLENESVWLTQKQLAELFQTTVPNINMHIKNIIGEGELEAVRTIQDFLIVQKEGIRKVQRNVEQIEVSTSDEWDKAVIRLKNNQ